MIYINLLLVLLLYSCDNAQNVQQDGNKPLFSIENKNYWIYQKIVDSNLVNIHTYFLKKTDSTWILKLQSSSKWVYNDSTLFEFYFKDNSLYILDYFNIMCSGQRSYYYKKIAPNTVDFYSPTQYIFKMRDMDCLTSANENYEAFFFVESIGLTKIEKKLTDYDTKKLKTVYSLILVESGYK